MLRSFNKQDARTTSWKYRLNPGTGRCCRKIQQGTQIPGSLSRKKSQDFGSPEGKLYDLLRDRLHWYSYRTALRRDASRRDVKLDLDGALAPHP